MFKHVGFSAYRVAIVTKFCLVVGVVNKSFVLYEYLVRVSF